MSLVKTHITFQSYIEDDAEAKETILNKIKQVSNISDVNQKRFERYGILTGVIDESLLEQVRNTLGVLEVEVDEEKFLAR